MLLSCVRSFIANGSLLMKYALLTIWTQKKAGELFGLERSVASKIVQNVDSNILNIRQQFYEKKKSVGGICSFNNMDAEKGGWSIWIDAGGYWENW